MMAEQRITDPEPTDLILTKVASERYAIRQDTLLYRIKHNKLPAYKKEINGKEVLLVSVADMEQQPPVDPKYHGRQPQKRPDVAERNKLKRKYVKKGQSDVSSPEEETYVEAQDQQLERHICYAFGRVQAWLDIYAGGIGASPSVLANRVGKLLQSAESGGSLGIGIKLSRL